MIASMRPASPRRKMSRGRSGLSKVEAERLAKASQEENSVLIHAEKAFDFAKEAQQDLKEGNPQEAEGDEERAEDYDKVVEERARLKKTRTAASGAVAKEREAIKELKKHNALEGGALAGGALEGGALAGGALEGGSLSGGARGHKTAAKTAVAAAKKAAKATEYDAVKEASGVTVGHSKRRSANRKRARERSRSAAREEGEKRPAPAAFGMWHDARRSYYESTGQKQEGVLSKDSPHYAAIKAIFERMKQEA